MITFQVEDAEAIYREGQALLFEHWKEIGIYDRDEIKLDPDWDTYIRAEQDNGLFVLTCRENGVLIGYYVAFIAKHPHYKNTTFSTSDILFLKKEKRKGLTGYKMLKEAEKRLKEAGVRITVLSVKTESQLHILAARMGYKPIDTTYFKKI